MAIPSGTLCRYLLLESLGSGGEGVGPNNLNRVRIGRDDCRGVLEGADLGGQANLVVDPGGDAAKVETFTGHGTNSGERQSNRVGIGAHGGGSPVLRVTFRYGCGR